MEINKIILKDCIEGMKDLSDSCIDLVITDPPFAIDFKAKKSNYNRNYANVIEGYSDIKSIDYPKFTTSWLEEVYRVLKPSGSAYIFSGWNNLKDILNAIDDIGFITVNHIIWKYQFGVVTKRKFISSHYHCLYICKDDKKRKFYPFSRHGAKDKSEIGRSLHYQDKEDVWLIKREYWRNQSKTPTKLPAELIKKILKYSSKEGDLILDPFIGSGQVAVVSKEMNRNYIGFEVVSEYYDFAQKRLEG